MHSSRPEIGSIESWLRRQCGWRLDRSQKLRRLAGINHQNYLVFVEEQELPDFLRLSGEGACYPNEAALTDSMVREASLLGRLEGKVGDWNAPRCLAFEPKAPEFHGPAMLMSVCQGLILEDFPRNDICQFVAEALSAVHSYPWQGLALGPRHDLETRAEALRDSARWDAELAGMWPLVESALGRPRTVCLVHGDMLPQNLIAPFDPTDQKAILDWEFARLGDPEYDLAILFRGTRKVFGRVDGRQQVLNAYAGAIDPLRLAAHEMLLLMNWALDSKNNQQDARTRLHRVYREALLAIKE